jgi:hypothetical protein
MREPEANLRLRSYQSERVAWQPSPEVDQSSQTGPDTCPLQKSDPAVDPGRRLRLLHPTTGALKPKQTPATDLRLMRLDPVWHHLLWPAPVHQA